MHANTVSETHTHTHSKTRPAVFVDIFDDSVSADTCLCHCFLRGLNKAVVYHRLKPYELFTLISALMNMYTHTHARSHTHTRRVRAICSSQSVKSEVTFYRFKYWDDVGVWGLQCRKQNWLALRGWPAAWPPREQTDPAQVWPCSGLDLAQI